MEKKTVEKEVKHVHKHHEKAQNKEKDEVKQIHHKHHIHKSIATNEKEEIKHKHTKHHPVKQIHHKHHAHQAMHIEKKEIEHNPIKHHLHHTHKSISNEKKEPEQHIHAKSHHHAKHYLHNHADFIKPHASEKKESEHHPHHIKHHIKHRMQHHKHHTNNKEYNSEINGVKILPLEKRTLRNNKELAMDFAEKVHKKFDRLVKASILFGSQATNTSTSTSDIDIILIIDDASINWDLELVAWYREELGKIIAAQGYAEELHINSIKLTTWWQDFMHGDPVVVNILRYGEALIDYGGFFNPLKSLLLQGRVRSTPEAVYNALQRAPAHLTRSKIAILNSIEGVYWTMIDSAQAALITAGQLPPSPEHIPQMLKETFVDHGFLNINRVRDLREIYVLHKGITHNEIHQVKGVEIDKWQDLAESFLLEMTRLIDKILESKKE